MLLVEYVLACETIRNTGFVNTVVVVTTGPEYAVVIEWNRDDEVDAIDLLVAMVQGFVDGYQQRIEDGEPCPMV
jgi:putative intracellular protease/amidase